MLLFTQINYHLSGRQKLINSFDCDYLTELNKFNLLIFLIYLYVFSGGNSSSSSCGDRASSARKTSSVQAVKRTGLNGTGNISPRPRTTFSNGTTLNKPVPTARAFPKPSTRPMSAPRISNPEPTR